MLWMARAALTRSTGSEDVIFTQKRVGQGVGLDRLFEIEKLKTLGPDKKPLSPLSGWFRKTGIDELAQIANIRRGEMSVCGYRPTIPSPSPGTTSFEEIMDNLSSTPALQRRWKYVTASSNPGVVSSYGLHQHTHKERDPNEFEIRAEMDVQDAMGASIATNAALIGSFIWIALQQRLQ
jgi:lipopolysaccharide/colanic/teichoic acid biosynthesis glycosyltransferase